MAVLKSPRLDGKDLGIGFAGKALVSFISYGQHVTAGGVGYSTRTAMVNVLADPASPDSVSILTQPSEGRAVARSDGRITLDLRGEHGLSDLTFTYRRVVDGRPETITATISRIENMRPAGHCPGDYFSIETDAADNPLPRYAENPIIKHFSTSSGLTDAQILARHDGTGDQLDRSNVRGRDIMEVPARDENGDLIVPTVYYGETEDLAINSEAFSDGIRQSLMQYQFALYPRRQWVFRFKRGDTFSLGLRLLDLHGPSRYQPAIIETYGTGEAPLFTGDLFSTGGNQKSTINVAVLGPFRYADQATFQQVDNVLADNIFADRESYSGNGDYPLNVRHDGNSGLARRPTARRYKTWEVWYPSDEVDTGRVWSDINGDRVSGAYAEDAWSVLYEKMYLDTTGWRRGYYPDRRKTGPKSPDDASHGIYTQGDIIDLTFRDVLTIDAGGSAVQIRSGGVVERVVAIGANMGILYGNGESPGRDLSPASGDGNLGNPPVLNGEQRRKTHMTYACDNVVLEAGLKDVDSQLNIIAGGFDNSNHQTRVLRHAALNTIDDGVAVGWSNLDQPVGPIGKIAVNAQTYGFRLTDASAPAGAADWFEGTPDILVHNFCRNRNPGNLPGNISAAAVEAVTSGGYHDSWRGSSGATKLDLIATLRAEPAPWEQIDPMLEYIQTPLEQYVGGRTLGTTVRFLPLGGTPGMRADVPDDWSTKDYPGRAEGDSMDLEGHDLRWNISPEHDLDHVTLGPGGRLELSAGHLNWTGDMVCEGNDIFVRGGARLRGNSITGKRPSIVVNDGLFENTGAWSGGIDLKVVCDARAILVPEGGSMTFGVGDRLTIGGYALAGADGTGGGTGTLTFGSGSKLRFQVGVIAECRNSGHMAPCLGTVSGGASGATAVVEDFYRTKHDGVRGFEYKLYDLTGLLQVGEVLRCDDAKDIGAVLSGTVTTDAGTITGVEAAFGQLRKFRSGEHGLAATDMTFNIALGGTLEIDLRGHRGALTHKLIEADALSESFDTVSVLNLGARDAIVTIGATSVIIEVTVDGSGQLSVI